MTSVGPESMTAAARWLLDRGAGTVVLLSRRGATEPADALRPLLDDGRVHVVAADAARRPVARRRLRRVGLSIRRRAALTTKVDRTTTTQPADKTTVFIALPDPSGPAGEGMEVRKLRTST